MNLCDSGHEEICYECRNCPLCEANREIESLENIVEELKESLEELKEELEESLEELKKDD
jgi:predicted RNase H-like HicB family nuclease